MSSQKVQYQKIDLSNVDRKKIKKNHGIETNEKIKIFDEIKHEKQLWTFPQNFKTSDIRCFWDHHTFDTVGIFCPLSYRPKQVAKLGQTEVKQRSKNISDLNIDNFMIKENIPKNKDISTLNNIIEITDAYYEVDGIFCSPECCLAFINDQKTKVGGSKYFDSKRLLYNMLNLTKEEDIFPANDFRLLKCYGGNLSIEQFRNNNKSISYQEIGTTVLISHLYEKKINLSLN